VELNGYFSDSAYTFIVGTAKPVRQETCELLWKLAIRHEQAVAGNHIGDIAAAIGSYVTDGFNLAKAYQDMVWEERIP